MLSKHNTFSEGWEKKEKAHSFFSRSRHLIVAASNNLLILLTEVQQAWLLEEVQSPQLLRKFFIKDSWAQQGRSRKIVFVQFIGEIDKKKPEKIMPIVLFESQWWDLSAAVCYHRDKQQDGTLWELWHLKENKSGMKCWAVGELKTLHNKKKTCFFLKKQKDIYLKKESAAFRIWKFASWLTKKTWSEKKEWCLEWTNEGLELCITLHVCVCLGMRREITGVSDAIPRATDLTLTLFRTQTSPSTVLQTSLRSLTL